MEETRKEKMGENKCVEGGQGRLLGEGEERAKPQGLEKVMRSRTSDRPPANRRACIPPPLPSPNTRHTRIGFKFTFTLALAAGYSALCFNPSLNSSSPLHNIHSGSNGRTANAQSQCPRHRLSPSRSSPLSATTLRFLHWLLRRPQVAAPAR